MDYDKNKRSLILRTLMFFFLGFVSTAFAQDRNLPQYTPGGVFDYVSDRFGNRYHMSEIATTSAKPFGGSASVNLSLGCTSGYFDLYFDPNSSFSLAAAQASICQLFSDISGFLPSALSPTTPINIYCTTESSGALASASQIYVYPVNPNNPNQGFLQGQIEKGIQSGKDPYFNIPITFSNSLKFFHGIIRMSPIITFDYNLSTIPTTNYDFYSTMLHEVAHALGFASLISSSGFSQFGQSNNYFSIYDKFLQNYAGSPLLVSNTPTTCSAMNIVFNPAIALASINPSVCTTVNTPSDVSTCSLAAKYVGATTATVYTPNCYEQGSSLSHFEDICKSSITTCTATPPNNNLYFSMANSTFIGPCYMKRYLKPEEQQVLCDLGYTVSFQYTSNSTALITPTGNVFNYNATCSPTNVFGFNDGISSNSYSWSSTGTLITVPILAVTGNDIPSTVAISCLSLVYNSAAINANYTTSGANILVTANAGSGLVILSYIPVSPSGQKGNLTYIYVYFQSANCNPNNLCNMIQNPGFESLVGASSCGVMTVSAGPIISCWEKFEGFPAVFTRSCTSDGGVYNLGSNTKGISPAFNSFNGTGNDIVLGLSFEYASSTASTQAIKNNLSSPLVNSNVYEIEFFANNPASNIPGNNVSSSPVVITIASQQVYGTPQSQPFPSGLNVITEFTLPAASVWSLVSTTFTFSSPGGLNHNCLLVGINHTATIQQGALSLTSPPTTVWCYLDQFRLVTSPNSNFSAPGPICGNHAVKDLTNYVAIGGGVFSGNHVTQVGSQYHFNIFNQNGPLTPGQYPVAYTYTSGGCQDTDYQMITVTTNTNLIVLNSTVLCQPSGTVDLNGLFADNKYVGLGTFSLNGTTNGTLATVSTAGNYSVAFTFTAPGSGSLCSIHSNTALISVYPVPTPVSILNGTTALSSTVACVSDNNLTLTAASSATNFIWNPGAIPGANLIAPATGGIYTITAFDHSLCAITATLALTLHTNCCQSVITSTISGSPSSLSGQVMISQNLTVSGTRVMIAGEIRFKPNVKVIVPAGAQLQIFDSHLLACDNSMWDGIEVQNGGLILMGNSGGDNLIEDAKTAVKLHNHSSVAVNGHAISNTTFNKNYIDIDIANYAMSSSSHTAFINVNNCVFTCRDLPFTPTAWPQTGIVSTANTTSADLRTAINATTGLASPYLDQGFSTVNLKAPYQNQRSHIAIKLDNVGTTSGSNFYGLILGSAATSTAFNLFDAHGQFISSLNSNIKVNNSVFQNTQRYVASIGSLSINLTVGGDAIYHANNLMNSELDLRAASVSLGNKFWNCHVGLRGADIFRLNLDNVIMRSTQSTTNTGFQQGNSGLVLKTNRFQYKIDQCEFTNLRTAVNIPIGAGTYSTISSGNQTGIFADKIIISQNTITPGSSTNSYVDLAVNISSPNNYPPFVANQFSVAPYEKEIRVSNNLISDVYKGVYINVITQFLTKVNENDISLRATNSSQHAIDFSNTFGGAPNLPNWMVINSNTLSSPATSTNESLVYCGSNIGLYSPSITCNYLTSGYHGFVFDQTNTLTTWMANVMQPMNVGLDLRNNGAMGVQGSTYTAMNNEWANNWTSSSHTQVDNISFSQSSPIFVKNASGFVPLNNAGLNAQSYAAANAVFPVGPGSWDFACGSEPTNISIPLPNPNDERYTSDEFYYMDQNIFYRYLHFNDSLRNQDPFTGFYEALQGSSIDYFIQAESALLTGDFISAREILENVTSQHLIENNYVQFYTIYCNYLENLVDELALTEADSSALAGLAKLCAGVNGNSVYQARALYNYIYQSQILFNDCDVLYGERRSQQGQRKIPEIKITHEDGKFLMFPNPTSGDITISNLTNTSEARVEIHDVLGRMQLVKHFKGTSVNWTLTLQKGIYYVTIFAKGSNNSVKKLVIE